MNYEQRLIAAAKLVLDGDARAEDAPVNWGEFGVTATLKPHQVEGVSWLIRRYLLGVNVVLGRVLMRFWLYFWFKSLFVLPRKWWWRKIEWMTLELSRMVCFRGLAFLFNVKYRTQILIFLNFLGNQMERSLFWVSIVVIVGFHCVCRRWGIICLQMGIWEKWPLLNWVELNFEFTWLRTSHFNSWALNPCPCSGNPKFYEYSKFNWVSS